MQSLAFYYKSPLGSIEIVYDDDFIRSLIFKEGPETTLPESFVLNQCVIQLGEYFEGKRKLFDLPLFLEGTAFQKKVWEALKEIPYASTVTYKDLSVQLGDVKSIRAVAHANGLNQFIIVIPCHRVVGTNGAMIGYAGGLKRKQWLLEHENKILPSGQVRMEFI
jgi:methylated-DNA-[protein]-cysteine S-methyltransferase